MPKGTSTTGTIVATALVVVVVGTVVLHRFDSSSAAATTTTTIAVTTTTAPPAPTTTTTTTIAAADLPQTMALPPTHTPGLNARMRALFRAVSTGDAAVGYPSFFPLAAYLQVKGGYNNEADYHYRLLGYFDHDVAQLHASLGAGAASARLLGYSVNDSQAVWVLPGVEFNKGPYWRVYYTTLTYAIGARRGSVSINTMISWRGEWYVVHLIGFNS